MLESVLVISGQLVVFFHTVRLYKISPLASYRDFAFAYFELSFESASIDVQLQSLGIAEDMKYGSAVSPKSSTDYCYNDFHGRRCNLASHTASSFRIFHALFENHIFHLANIFFTFVLIMWTR